MCACGGTCNACRQASPFAPSRKKVVLDFLDFDGGNRKAREAVEILALAAEDSEGERERLLLWLANEIEKQTRPPKPEEPTGLGAVVQDENGDRWVRRDDSAPPVWVHAEGTVFPRPYERLAAVKVLSQGWSE